jgi:Domain of unknown function (DUF1844)
MAEHSSNESSQEELASAQSGQAPVPPADFLFLVESILFQAQVQLGLLHFSKDDEPAEPNLPLARHSIDLLGMLQQKTRGNLSLEEQRLLENGLTELRFRFVQVGDELKKKQGAPAVDHTQEDRPLIITPDGGKGIKST